MRYTATVTILGGILSMMSAISAFAAEPGVDYLSAMPDRIVHLQQGLGELGINVAAHEPGQTPVKLRMGDKSYENGLGSHAHGEIVFSLDGQYDTFEAEVGVQWQDGQPGLGSVVLQAYVDGELRFDSGVMKQADPAKTVRVPVAGALELRLVSGDAGDGITCDAADWAEARLTRSQSGVSASMDIAPFAQVCTWEPARMDGARATRLEEFRAEDLFTGTDLVPDSSGSYSAPSYSGNLNCIGLEWMERRRVREVGLELASGDELPMGKVQVQAWVGESKWQGGWQPVVGKLEQQGGKLAMRISFPGNAFSRTGTPKLRWILPGSGDPIKVCRVWAITSSHAENTDIVLSLAKPQRVQFDAYNGYFEGGKTKRAWDGKRTLRLNVRGCDTTWSKLDRTVIRFRAGKTELAFAVDDVLANGCVYIPEAGLLAADPAKGITLDSYLESIAGRKTVLERVREMPDQTLSQAMAKSRNPIQDLGPMAISLACDNRKLVVEREGAIWTTRHSDALPDTLFGAVPLYRVLTPRFGSGKNEGLKRHLDGGWMPAQVNSVRESGITYTQRTFVAPTGGDGLPHPADWLDSKPVCVVELTIENTNAQPADASVQLDFHPGPDTEHAIELRQTNGGAIAQIGGRLMAWADPGAASRLSTRVEGTSLFLTGSLPAGEQVKCVAYLPAWEAKPEDRAQLRDPDRLFAGFQEYWNRVMAPSMQIELPDQFVEDLIRASEMHCLVAGRNENGGERIAPWIASTFYGPLESEASAVVAAMSLFGHEEFTRRSLDYFIRRYKPEGYMTTGYTLMGMGWHLWSLGDYCRLYDNKPWLEANSVKIDRLCRWIVAQTEKTRKLDSRGAKVPEYGLMPPGVYADWNSFFYGFGLDGNYYKGLAEAASALAGIEAPDADSLQRGADDLRNSIRRAYELMQAITPVIPLKDGTWVRPYPSRLFIPGPIGSFFPGEDANRSWGYDIECGSHQMVPQGILDPASRQVTEMMDNMEDVQFLGKGWLDYGGDNEQDWYNLGGFAKIQPYYARNAEIYAQRDDVKPFVRSYFNTLASMVSTENMSFWEHFRCSGAYSKTHETAYFLQQSRLMLVMERGDDLWLAPLITSNWLKDGMVVATTNAPTAFGPVSYRITSHVAQGCIEASIDPPTRKAPKRIVIRLRHPEGKRMRSVTVNGRKHAQFDPAKETIAIRPNGKRISVRAEY